MIYRGAQHKVYERTNTIQLQAPHICRARAARHFCGEHRAQHPNLGACADRVAERRGSRRRCRIDHAEALLRRRLAQQQPAQGPGGPCRAPPLCRLPPPIRSGARLTVTLDLERLELFDRPRRLHTSLITLHMTFQPEIRQASRRHGHGVRGCRRPPDGHGAGGRNGAPQTADVTTAPSARAPDKISETCSEIATLQVPRHRSLASRPHTWLTRTRHGDTRVAGGADSFMRVMGGPGRTGVWRLRLCFRPPPNRNPRPPRRPKSQ